MIRATLVFVGAYLCVVGSIVHRQMTYAGGVGLPWGLVLVIGCTIAVVTAARHVLGAGAGWLGLGWGLMLMGLQFSPGGGYLVASDWLGLSFAAGSLGVIVVGAVRAPRVVQ